MTIVAFYAGAALPVMRGLYESGLLSTAFADELYRAPVMLLAAASASGLALQALARRPADMCERAHRRWISALLILMLACAAASLGDMGASVGPAPDYLLLLFFCVSLYYRERLIFFDLLVKRGAFLAVGMAILTLCLAIGPSTHTAWIYGLALLPGWLAAPWISRRLAQTIDHVWLDRSYTPAEAERQVLHEIQIAATEDELRSLATASLGGIFRAPAEVCFEAAAAAQTEWSR